MDGRHCQVNATGGEGQRDKLYPRRHAEVMFGLLGVTERVSNGGHVYILIVCVSTGVGPGC